MMDIYLEIDKRGLSDYEENTRSLKKILKGESTPCQYNRECHKGIRCIQPKAGGGYAEYSCPSYADDRKHEVGTTPFKYDIIKESCRSCELFDICNGCRKTIEDMIEAGEVGKHCSEMKKRKKQILSLREDHGKH